MPIYGNRMTQTPKNTAMATAIDSSMRRVIVAPINTPSHINADMPATGITNAHTEYSLLADMTSASDVSSARKPSPANQ